MLNCIKDLIAVAKDNPIKIIALFIILVGCVWATYISIEFSAEIQANIDKQKAKSEVLLEMKKECAKSCYPNRYDFDYDSELCYCIDPSEYHCMSMD